MTRTKTRWVTDKRALYTILSLRGLQKGDYLAFRCKSKIIGGTKRDSDSCIRGRLEISCPAHYNFEYICDVYGNPELVRRDFDGWSIIGWRRP